MDICVVATSRDGSQMSSAIAPSPVSFRDLSESTSSRGPGMPWRGSLQLLSRVMSSQRRTTPWSCRARSASRLYLNVVLGHFDDQAVSHHVFLGPFISEGLLVSLYGP